MAGREQHPQAQVFALDDIAFIQQLIRREVGIACALQLRMMGINACSGGLGQFPRAG